MDSKTILAVWHIAAKGKTSTLRAAANYLLASYPNFKPVNGAPSSVPPSGDFRIVVKIGAKIVAIESKGDPYTDLLERLEELARDFQADIIICTTRTKGETVAAVEDVEQKYGYDAIWTSTYQASPGRQTVANDQKGQHLINLLQALKIL